METAAKREEQPGESWAELMGDYDPQQGLLESAMAHIAGPSNTEVFAEGDKKEGAAPQQFAPLTPRQKEIVRLAASGKSIPHIANTVGFPEDAIAALLQTPRFQQELGFVVDKKFERSAPERIDDLMGSAADTIEEILRGATDMKNAKVRKETAIWVMEKLTGKPKQDVNVSSNTLDNFMRMMREVRDSGQILDITKPALPPPSSETTNEPEEVEQPSKFARWVDENT